MRSMTGFGRGMATGDGWEITVHVSSVNRKTLEVASSLPREWQVFEPEVAAVVRQWTARGRIQVTAEVHGPGQAGVTWDEAAVDSALDRLAALAARRGVAWAPTPEVLFAVAAASRSEAPALGPERALGLVLAALGQAMAGMQSMREREGAALAGDIGRRVAALAERVEEIARRAPGTLRNYREMLLHRLRGAGLELDLNDERVLKEIALFADRIDVSEEITRLRSHLVELAALPGAAEPIGRKAEFLLQEIGREIHTVGSKANDIEIARAVIEFKNEVERIREQIQNVE